MRRAEDENMIQTFPSKRSDQAFGTRQSSDLTAARPIAPVIFCVEINGILQQVADEPVPSREIVKFSSGN
jgi:hypothetical protein